MAFARAADLLLKEPTDIAQRVQDRPRASHHHSRADAGGDGRRSRSPQAYRVRNGMAPAIRHFHLPRRRPRQGYRPREICRRIQRDSRAGPWGSRVLHHRQGPYRAHRRRARALAMPGVVDVISHRNRPDIAWFDRKAYHDEVAPRRFAVSSALDDRIRFNGQPIALVLC